jgi:hypothetical protein
MASQTQAAEQARSASHENRLITPQAPAGGACSPTRALVQALQGGAGGAGEQAAAVAVPAADHLPVAPAAACPRQFPVRSKCLIACLSIPVCLPVHRIITECSPMHDRHSCVCLILPGMAGTGAACLLFGISAAWIESLSMRLMTA